MSKLATLELTGISKNKYEFDVYSYTSEFPNLSCIYCVSNRRYNSKLGKFSHEIIYIGKTNDISLVLATHNKKDCFELRNPNCISIYKSNSDRERIQIEEDLIKNYKPVCNDL
jgi:hypothetical protein